MQTGPSTIVGSNRSVIRVHCTTVTTTMPATTRQAGRNDRMRSATKDSGTAHQANDGARSTSTHHSSTSSASQTRLGSRR
ncbi:hypothetical protein JOF29_007347 [Kribbella aluminosa]|uniref:Uncharacterized protein n=1 Tax=Kribbella aluminosa TaxID=416017 RepID=A0ABS4UX96_9ACTN|nr:hypothetical protein [Kribbella aluminosa]